MRFKFNPNQQYQLDAISSVVDLFEGIEKSNASFRILPQTNGRGLLEDMHFKNYLPNIDISTNLKKVQEKNNIFSETKFSDSDMNFSIEMETGTGKTYVYLRTIFELNKQYGFSKFIIVVPSVAIREGVLKSIDLMKDHFQELYESVPFDYFVYDSKKLNRVKNFSTDTTLRVMIVNIDAFNKAHNIMIQEREDGRYIDFIRQTNPIVVMDEPQNMESETAREAISLLNPLFTLRYSATHREPYNLVYRLGPVEAFQRRLVKRISVLSVVQENDPTQSYIKVIGISNKNNKFTCKLEYFKISSSGVPKKSTGIFRQDDDLYLKSKENEIYKNGFIVTEINATPGQQFVKFSNGIRLSLYGEQGGVKEEVIKKQIRETIKTHFDKELQLGTRGVKVLSLFFLDKVSNYRVYENNGHRLGTYARYFEEIYNELSQSRDYENLDITPVSEVHNGYFSMDRGKMKDTMGNSLTDADTYSLIMQDKEKLLDIKNPLKFIFSHSALREGWDNPNVFQICTLNETASEMKRRQEIGRGMRLPVNQKGDRIEDEQINNLVIVANESYEEFARGLQKNFEKEGITFGRLPVEAFVGLYYSKGKKQMKVDVLSSKKIWNYLKKKEMLSEQGEILSKFDQSIDDNTFSVPAEFKSIKNEIIKTIENHKPDSYIRKYKTEKVKLNKETLLDPEFKKFWEKISKKTVYSVSFDTQQLIEKASQAVKDMPSIEPLKIITTTARVDTTNRGIEKTLMRTPVVEPIIRENYLPDILSYIQERLQLTRKTIFEILKRSERLEDSLINPQQFMDSVVKEIKVILHKFIVEGIKYERLDAISYEMSRFEEEEDGLRFIASKIIATQKSIHNYICYDYGVEKKFAEALENMDDIKYFVKLPNWFKVPTPVGNYNPDWAILKQNGDVVYMIRETKSTLEESKWRPDEQDKVKCGTKHFESIGVDYRVCTSVEDAF